MNDQQLPHAPEEGTQPKKSRERVEKESTDWGQLFSAYGESHRASLVDSLKRMFGHPFGSFFTCLVMGITLSLPMGLSLLLGNVERLGGSWQRAAQISLYLDLKTSESQGQDLRVRVGLAVLVEVAGHDAEERLVSCGESGDAHVVSLSSPRAGPAGRLRGRLRGPAPARVLTPPAAAPPPRGRSPRAWSSTRSAVPPHHRAR